MISIKKQNIKINSRLNIPEHNIIEKLYNTRSLNLDEYEYPIGNRTEEYAEKLASKNARMLILGSKDHVGPKLASAFEKAEDITKGCTGITVCFCFNYGGEKEIADAANLAIKNGETITPESIRGHLYHPEVPDIDMVVRTSGEERISGFMLWRSSYAEFMFIKKYFPEMSGDDITTILAEFNSRSRRFGK